jgi:hypothetical protein
MSAVNLVWWEAVLHWQPGKGEFGKLFWSMWHNHMASYGRKVKAEKRPLEVTTVDSDGYDTLDRHVDPPYRFLTYTGDDDEQIVIGMLALGYLPGEVSSVVGRRTYYKTISKWKENREHYE